VKKRFYLVRRILRCWLLDLRWLFRSRLYAVLRYFDLPMKVPELLLLSKKSVHSGWVGEMAEIIKRCHLVIETESK
jgi:hypothetical protein